MLATQLVHRHGGVSSTVVRTEGACVHLRGTNSAGWLILALMTAGTIMLATLSITLAATPSPGNGSGSNGSGGNLGYILLGFTVIWGLMVIALLMLSLGWTRRMTIDVERGLVERRLSWLGFVVSRRHWSLQEGYLDTLEVHRVKPFRPVSLTGLLLLVLGPLGTLITLAHYWSWKKSKGEPWPCIGFVRFEGIQHDEPPEILWMSGRARDAFDAVARVDHLLGVAPSRHARNMVPLQ